MVATEEQFIAEEFTKIERENTNKRLLRMEKNKTCHLYEVKENIYITPIKKYGKFKTKSPYYDNLYRSNTIYYYIYTNLHLASKLFRKKMLRKVFSTTAIALFYYFFKHTGAMDKLFQLIGRLVSSMKNRIRIFKR